MGIQLHAPSSQNYEPSPDREFGGWMEGEIQSLASVLEHSASDPEARVKAFAIEHIPDRERENAPQS